MAAFKGVFVSLAGPVATQALQKVLAARTPRDAALVNASGVAVVSVPRYLMIGGLTALALAFFSREVEAMGANMDFELLLPLAVKNLIPVGLSGLVLAGLLSAHMSTVSSFLNLVPAFFVNDIYKKYFRPDAPDRTYVRMSYAVTAAVTVASIGFGIAVGSVDAATRWIVSALWAGSAAANVLKWHWWRFNGYGYFLGMLAGLLVALALPVFFPHLDALEAYPWILLISGTASVGGTFLAPPESDRLLMSFYTTVRPWGLWKPVLLKVRAASPEFLPNRDFGRDFLNVLVGIVWQLSLMAAPLAFVLKDWGSFAWTAAVAMMTTVLLKKFWFDRLDNA
jgi:Na+/proline symporter